MEPSPLIHRLRVLWYRYALGLTPTQAEYRAARAASTNPRPAAGAGRAVAAAQPEVRRFLCVCGQLLTTGDRACHACGRRQLVPYSARLLGRALRELLPAEHPAAVGVLGLILLGYALQWTTGRGGLFSPSNVLNDLELGASVASLTMGPQPWRAITYAFLHGGLMHLVMNLMTLVQIAPLIEGYFGSGRFLLAWAVTGAAGVLLPPLVFAGQGVTLGASGAICGLIGMAWIGAVRTPTGNAREVRRTMERWMIYTTLFGLALEFGAGVRVAHGAHFGGALAGVALGLVLPPPITPGRRRISALLGLIGGGLILAGLWAMIAWRVDGLSIPDTTDGFGQYWQFMRETARRNAP